MNNIRHGSYTDVTRPMAVIVVTLTLTINNSSTGTDLQTVVTVIWIDGNTYTSSNNTAITF